MLEVHFISTYRWQGFPWGWRKTVSLSTSMTAHNHCLMYSNEWRTLCTSVGASQARSLNHSRANNKYFARNIKNRLSWNWINAKEIGLKQVLWTKAKTSRTSRCKSGAETARWITSQCSMPLAILSLSFFVQIGRKLYWRTQWPNACMFW